MSYQTKIIDYNYKKKVVAYDFPIRTGGSNLKIRKKYTEMSADEKRYSDERRVQYYEKKKTELIELALMNSFKIMATLTFAEDIQMYDIAINRWRNFMRRMKWKYGEVPYICVWERTKKNRIHFHALFNMNIDVKELEKLWSYGFVWITGTKKKNEQYNAIQYMTKYMIKSIQERVQSGESVRGERFFFCSKNLNKPKIEKVEEKIDIEKEIFENMETVIRDGVYAIKDSSGYPINRIEFVEYRTEKGEDK